MRELGYTQDNMAFKLNITVQTLNAKLNGRSDFLLKEVLKLRDILGYEILEDFFWLRVPKKQQRNNLQ